MKKLTKIIVLLLFVMLIAGAIAVMAFAETGDTNAWQYTDASGETQTAATLQEAVTNSPAGGTVTLLRDYTITTTTGVQDPVATIDKALTVDLGGYTFTISQSYKESTINVTTANAVEFKNGTIHTSGNSDYIAHTLDNDSGSLFPLFPLNSYDSGFPFFALKSDNAQFTLTDVNTITPGIVYGNGSFDCNVTVNGGTHYGVYLNSDTTARGLFDFRNNATVTVNDARIRLESTQSLAALTHNKTAPGVEKHTELTFNNCLVAMNGSTNSHHTLIYNANEHCYFYFNNSYVFGSFMPKVNKWDTNTESTNVSGTVAGPMTSANIVLGEGTLWNQGVGNESTSKGFATVVPSIADGYVANNCSITVDHMFRNAPKDRIFETVAIDATSKCTYDYSLAVGAEGLNEAPLGFKITKSDGTAKYYDNYTLREMFSTAAAGSTVKLLSDHYYVSDCSAISVGKNLTLDLNDHTLTVDHQVNTTEASQAVITVGASYTLTVSGGANKSGTIKHDNSEKSGYTYAFFTASAGASVVLNDVVMYTGSLFYNHSADNPTLTVNGGEYYTSNYSHRLFGHSLIESRNNITVNATGAKFYLEKAGLAMSLHYNNSGSGTKASTFTFTRCDIVAASATQNVTQYSNEFTSMVFDGCNIRATMSPALNSSDEKKNIGAPTEANITLGKGTTVADGSTILGKVADGYNKLDDETNYTFAPSHLVDANGTKITATYKKAYRVGLASEADFIIIHNGEETLFFGTIAEAIAEAPAGATIKLNKESVTFQMGSAVTMSRGVTVDLGGNTLYIDQTAQQGGYFKPATTAQIKFMNGTIDVSTSYDSTTYALFQVQALNTNLVLKDLIVYAGCVYSNIAGHNSTLTVDGGEYHLTRTVGNLPGALIESRTNMTVNVTGAKLYVDSYKLMHSTSYKYTPTDDAPYCSTYTFTNCDIYRSAAGNNIISSINAHTTVTFTGCNIFGSVNPVIDRSFDGDTTKYPEATAENIILAEGTTLASGATFTAVTPEGYILAKDAAQYTFTATDVSKDYTKAYVVASEAGGNFTFKLRSPAGLEIGFDGTFAEALAAATSGYTIVFLGNVNYEMPGTTVSINKKLTFDLGGHTLNVNQTVNNNTGFSIGAYEVTFANGTIINRYNNSEDPSFSLFRVNANTVLNLNDLKVYASNLVYYYGSGTNKTTVNINGGEYHQVRATANLSGTLIETRGNMVLNAEGAKFYGGSGGVLFGMLSYVARRSVETGIENVVTFENCDFYAPGSQLMYLNEYGKVTFTGCNIAAGLDITPASNDLNTNTTTYKYAWTASAPLAGSIVIGEGNRFMKDFSFGSACVLEDGLVLFYDGDGYNENYHIYNNGTIAATPVTFETAFSARKLSSAQFRISYLGQQVYCGDDVDFKKAVSLADGATTLYVLQDQRIVTDANAAEAYLTINKALTIDLGENTFYFSQSDKKATIYINKNVVFENGTFVWATNENYQAFYSNPANSNNPENYTVEAVMGASYTLFTIGTDNITITFNDIIGYGSNIVDSSRTGTTVNINGGEFYVTKAIDVAHALVETRANANINIDGAKIYLNSPAGVVAVMSYKEVTAFENTTDIATNVTIENCDIIGATATQNVIFNANKFTTITFDGCRIHGSLNPSTAGFDTTYITHTSPVGGKIVLNKGNKLMVEATLADGIVEIDTANASYNDISESATITLSIATGTIYSLTSPDFEIGQQSKYITFTLEVGDLPYKFYTVTWYKETGAVLTTTRYKEGTVGITAPTYTPGSSNGWYIDGSSYVKGSWSATSDSTVAVDLAAYTVTGNASFYPTKSESTSTTPSAKLTGAQYNLSLSGLIGINFFIPNTPSGVYNVNVVDENGNPISYRGVWITENGEKVYYRHYELGAIDVTKLSTPINIKVTFDVHANDTVYNLTQNVKITPTNYISALLADSTAQNPVYSAQTHVLAADLVRYSSYLIKACGGAADSTIDALLTTYESLCSELPLNNDFGEYLTSTYPLYGYINSIQMAVTDYQPQWVFNFDASQKVVDVKVTLNGYYPLPDENGVNYGEIVYNLDTAKSTFSGDYLITAYVESIPMYNIDRTITITVTTEDGTVKSAQYSINTYFAYMNATGETLNNVREFLKAFRAFGITSAGYRYADGKISAEKEVDAFECAHEATEGGTWSRGNGRYCADCDRYVYFYEDYIEFAGLGGQVYDSRESIINDSPDGADTPIDGVVDSFTALYDCHYRAKLQKEKGYDVIVVANKGNQDTCVYYLASSQDTEGKIAEIPVFTDTDWNGAYVISDDRGWDIGDTAYKTAIFGIRGFNITPEDTAKLPSSANGKINTSGTNITSYFPNGIEKGATNIGWSCGTPVMLELYNSDQRRYVRVGANASTNAQQEVILIDEYGNVNPTTPITWKYENSANFVVEAFPITVEPIKVSGLDANGEINFTFENIVNNAVTATSYNGCSRNIMVRRANVIVEGIYHEFTEDNTSVTPRQAYSGLISVSLGANVLLKDMSVVNHNAHYVKLEDNKTDWTDANGNKNSLGSYEFHLSHSVNVTWENCYSRNFFSDGMGNPLDHTIYRGLFGTNGGRNMTLRNCVLNSFDAHSAAYNVYLENSTFEHINFIGHGDISIKNCAIYTAKSQAAVISLRDDYGAFWEGNIYIDGLDIRCGSDYEAAYVDLVRAYYQNYDLCNDGDPSLAYPFNIYANDIEIQKYTRAADGIYTHTNGIIDEANLTTADVALGIYYRLNDALKNHYDYSTENANNLTARDCTENIYISNFNGKIDYPDHPFFEDMNIYWDGDEQDWFKINSELKHEDKDNNYVCDLCSRTTDCTGDHEGNAKGSCDTCGWKISTCITGDTLVMLADGTEKRADELTLDDILLVYDHFAGEFVAMPIVFIENDGVADWQVVTLTFSDGTETKLISQHGYFDVTLNKYVYITANNYDEFIGHEFAAVAENGGTKNVTLTSATVATETTGCYSLATAYHYNFIVDGMLSMPGGIDGIFNIFEYGENLKYDEEKMAEDIAEYGLYTYDDFAAYVSEEIFDAFNAQYFKVAVGKGMITFEEILGYIEKYITGNGLA